MKKYQLRTFRPKGFDYANPGDAQITERLNAAGVVSHGKDNELGAFVVCLKKPEDFPEYGMYWVDVDDLIQ